MKPKTLSQLISSYFAPGIGAPVGSLPAAMVQNGSLPDSSSVIAILAAINANNAINLPNFQTSAAATITLTQLPGLVQRLTNGGAVTVTIDAAYNIVNQIPNPYVGQTFQFQIQGNASTTVATPTLLDTAVTLAGTTTLTSGGSRFLQGQVTQVVTTVGSALTAGSTWTSLAQIGATNLYTVTLGTNAVSPVVGNVIYLGVTAGTLPAGWYPIVKVTSATSFVIAAPIVGTAWTATAVTLPGTVLVPAAQYTPGLAGVYSPLVTITGMYGMAAGVIVV